MVSELSYTFSKSNVDCILNSYTGAYINANNKSSDPMQHWDLVNNEPTLDGPYVDAFYTAANLLVWTDLASPFLSPSPRAIMCCIDPIYHQAKNGKYYKVYWQLGSYIDSQALCKKRGARLATTYAPTDYNALDHIRQQMYTPLGFNNLHMWIDGTDTLIEGEWIMADGWSK
jgi:hypothetical protein